MKVIKIALFALLLTANTAWALVCPSGTAMVPAYSPYNGQAYCIMTHEAKKIDGTPWNWISSSAADAVCVAWKSNGNLPVNALWQSMARQAETVDANWTGGTVGVGALKPDVVIGSQTIYEVGNGHWEHVLGAGTQDVGPVNVADLPDSGAAFVLNGLSGNLKFHFGPIAVQGTYTAASKLGMVTRRASNYIMRGGDNDEVEQGVFAYAGNHAGEAASDVSFRCACPLAACGE